MTRRATCLCVLALLASASLLAVPAFAASSEEEASSEVAFAAAAAAAPSASAAVSYAVAPEAAPEAAAPESAAAAAAAAAPSSAVASAEAFAMAPSSASAEQFGGIIGLFGEGLGIFAGLVGGVLGGLSQGLGSLPGLSQGFGRLGGAGRNGTTLNLGSLLAGPVAGLLGNGNRTAAAESIGDAANVISQFTNIGGIVAELGETGAIENSLLASIVAALNGQGGAALGSLLGAGLAAGKLGLDQAAGAGTGAGLGTFPGFNGAPAPAPDGAAGSAAAASSAAAAGAAAPSAPNGEKIGIPGIPPVIPPVTRRSPTPAPRRTPAPPRTTPPKATPAPSATPAPTSVPVPPATTVPPAPLPPSSEKEVTLALHNVARARHGVPDLVWDESLAASSAAWAKGCRFAHSRTGENLCAGHRDWNACISAWYNEIASYNYKSGSFSSATGHATQMLWKASGRLGCHAQFCPRLYGGSNLYVCHYLEPGNVIGQFQQNVFPPVKAE